MTRKRVRIKNKGRLIGSFVFLVLLAGLFTSVFGSFLTVGATDKSHEDTLFVAVKSGDTLWKIAKENNPDNRNIRELVDNIIEYNNLSDVLIKPGQIIEIPLS